MTDEKVTLVNYSLTKFSETIHSFIQLLSSDYVTSTLLGTKNSLHGYATGASWYDAPILLHLLSHPSVAFFTNVSF